MGLIERLAALKNLGGHPWYGAQLKKLKNANHEKLLKFLSQTAALDSVGFQKEIQKTFTGGDSQTSLIAELLVVVNQEAGDKTMGTPKYLDDAIFNGVREAILGVIGSEIQGGQMPPAGQAIIIANHVRDFINNNLGTAMLEMEHYAQCLLSGDISEAKEPLESMRNLHKRLTQKRTMPERKAVGHG